MLTLIPAGRPDNSHAVFCDTVIDIPEHGKAIKEQSGCKDRADQANAG